MTVSFTLNGKSTTVDVPLGMSLFDFLRGSGIFSVKFGSDKGEAGCDTVLINGRAFNASLVLIHSVAGKAVETLESLVEDGKLHPLQQSFLDAGAMQSGYTAPGMIMSIIALLRENPYPTEEDIRDALAGNLDRETGYVKPVQAVMDYLASRCIELVEMKNTNKNSC